MIKLKVKKTSKGVNHKFTVNNSKGEFSDTFYLKTDKFELPAEVCTLAGCGLLINIGALQDSETVHVLIDGDGERLNSVTEAIVVDLMKERRLCFRQKYDLPALTKVNISYAPHMVETPHVQCEPKTCMNSFSFGKESQLTRLMAKEHMGLTYKGGLFFEFSTYIRGVWQQQYEKYDDIREIRSNHNHLTNFAKTFGIDTKNVRFNTMMPLVYVAFAYATRVQYFFMGNDYGCNFFNQDKETGELYTFWDLGEETQYVEVLMTALMQSLMVGKPAFSSLVSPVREDAILYILAKHFNTTYNNLKSCWYPTEKKNYCGRCDKCYMFREIAYAANIPTPEGLIKEEFPQMGYEIDLKHHMSEYQFIPFELQEPMKEFYGKFLEKDEEPNPWSIFGSTKPWVVEQTHSEMS